MMTTEELLKRIEDKIDDRMTRLEDRITGISRSLETASTTLGLHADREGPREIHHTPPCAWSGEHLAAHKDATESRERRRNWRFALIGALAAIVGAVTGVVGALVAALAVLP